MEPKIITQKITSEELAEITKNNYETMVKVDVDIDRGILAIGGEWHSEGDELLHADGSEKNNVWGVNFYPWNPPEKRIQYISLINIKPSLGHTKMQIQDPELQKKIRTIIEKFLLDSNETLHS